MFRFLSLLGLWALFSHHWISLIPISIICSLPFQPTLLFSSKFPVQCWYSERQPFYHGQFVFSWTTVYLHSYGTWWNAYERFLVYTPPQKIKLRGLSSKNFHFVYCLRKIWKPAYIIRTCIVLTFILLVLQEVLGKHVHSHKFARNNP